MTWVAGVSLIVAGLVAVPSMTREDRHTPQPDSARVRLIAALSGSDNLSYRLKITAAHKNEAGVPFVVEGVFDPATRTGRLYAPNGSFGGRYEQRLIEGTLYIGVGDAPFKVWPGTFDRLNYSSVLGNGLIGTADPQELFRTLATAAVTQTGPAGYHFEADLVNDPSSGIHSDRLVGDLTLNGGNRIEKVTYERRAQTTRDGLPLTLIEANTVELSGYGEPVAVERPANTAGTAP
jgi:hypothetical protein